MYLQDTPPQAYHWKLLIEIHPNSVFKQFPKLKKSKIFKKKYLTAQVKEAP